MDTTKRVLKEQYLDLLTSMANLAALYGDQELWKEAEELGVYVMEKRTKLLGPGYPDTLIGMSRLAMIYWNQKRWEDAEVLQTQVMEARKTALGEEHSDTLASMADLASTYWNQGQWKKAERLEAQRKKNTKRISSVDRQSTSPINVDLPDKAELPKSYNTQRLPVSLEVEREEHKAETSFVKDNMVQGRR